MASFFPGGKKMLLLMPFLLYDVKNHCPDFPESFLKYIQVVLEKKKQLRSMNKEGTILKIILL